MSEPSQGRHLSSLNQLSKKAHPPPLLPHTSTLATNRPTRTSFGLLSRSVAGFLLVVMKHKQGVKGDGEDTLEARVWKGTRWDMCCLERGTKAASDGSVSAPTDIAPIKEGTEETGSGGKEQRDRITQRDEEGRQEGCWVNVWNESSGGRGEHGTQPQSEQRKNEEVFWFGSFSYRQMFDKHASLLLRGLFIFFGGGSWGLRVAERETVANLAIRCCSQASPRFPL